jgi:hypothetical protein
MRIDDVAPLSPESGNAVGLVAAEKKSRDP